MWIFLDRIASFEKEIAESEDEFIQAVKYAIIRNVIDFNPIHELTVSDVNDKFKIEKREEAYYGKINSVLFKG